MPSLRVPTVVMLLVGTPFMASAGGKNAAPTGVRRDALVGTPYMASAGEPCFLASPFKGRCRAKPGGGVYSASACNSSNRVSQWSE